MVVVITGTDRTVIPYEYKLFGHSHMTGLNSLFYPIAQLAYQHSAPPCSNLLLSHLFIVTTSTSVPISKFEIMPNKFVMFF